MRKILLVIVIVSICLPVKISWSSSLFDLSVSYNFMIPTDSSLQQGNEIKGKLAYKDFYIWGTHSTTGLRLYGQGCGKYEIWGIGAGIQQKVSYGFKLFGEIGWFWPFFEEREGAFPETMIYSKSELIYLSTHSDAVKKQMMDRYSNYEYKISGNVGVTVGLQFERKLFRNLFLNFDASYRFVKFNESRYAWPITPMQFETDYLEWVQHRNFSSGIIGVGVTYQF